MRDTGDNIETKESKVSKKKSTPHRTLVEYREMPFTRLSLVDSGGLTVSATDLIFVALSSSGDSRQFFLTCRPPEGSISRRGLDL